MICRSDENKTWIDGTGLPTDETEPRVLSAIARDEISGRMPENDREMCDRWISARVKMIRDVYRENPHVDQAQNILEWKTYKGLADEARGTEREQLFFLVDRGWTQGMAAQRLGIPTKKAKQLLDNR